MNFQDILSCRIRDPVAMQHRAGEGRPRGPTSLATHLETVHRTPLPDLAHREVFAPLSMSSTHFKADPRQVIPRSASAYQATDRGWQHTQGPATVPGSGSLWSTPDDLDRWLTHLHHTWQHQQLPWQGKLAYTPSDHVPYLYGPGLCASTCGDAAAVFHYGHEQGFSAAVHLKSGGLRVISCPTTRTPRPITSPPPCSRTSVSIRNATTARSSQRQPRHDGRPARLCAPRTSPARTPTSAPSPATRPPAVCGSLAPRAPSTCGAAAPETHSPAPGQTPTRATATRSP
ncbi:serine hydrolase [Streptomyces scopuliridis]|uniref:serine hydrolase n=1 Tax=Streptomyces scopuliridis TaxID=452529 RepID=UPI00389A5495